MVWKPDPERGFLPKKDPLTHLPKKFGEIDALGGLLPTMIKDGSIREVLGALEPIPTSSLRSPAEISRARMIYSFAASACVHTPNKEPGTAIPAGIAVPLVELSRKLGMPPIMSYTDYALNNWRRKDPKGAICVDNLELLQQFSGVPDEAWFILIHVEIEAEAGLGLHAITMAQQAVRENYPVLVEDWLGKMCTSLDDMNTTLKRMQEGCSPEVYYHSVRPYLFGFKGVKYEGTGSRRWTPRTLRGETGAHSSDVPSYVAALGIKHKAADGHGGKNPLLPHLRVMRRHMPPEHRAFIRFVERGPSIRNYILKNAGEYPALKDVYNEALTGLRNFRTQHLELATTYIHQQVANPEGSGGTIFMPWLKLLRDETEEHLIR